MSLTHIFLFVLSVFILFFASFLSLFLSIPPLVFFHISVQDILLIFRFPGSFSLIIFPNSGFSFLCKFYSILSEI